jgi:hypothetical protein
MIAAIGLYGAAASPIGWARATASVVEIMTASPLATYWLRCRQEEFVSARNEAISATVVIGFHSRRPI